MTSQNAIIVGKGIHTELGVLGIDGSGYLDAGDFSGKCISDPGLCKHGLTVSMWLRYKGLYSSAAVFIVIVKIYLFVCFNARSYG